MIFFSRRGQECSYMWRTKKNLVDKKIGIEIGLSDATIVIWTASFFVCNSLSVQWPTNNCFSNSNDIIGRKKFPKETETRYWFPNITESPDNQIPLSVDNILLIFCLIIQNGNFKFTWNLRLNFESISKVTLQYAISSMTFFKKLEIF